MSNFDNDIKATKILDELQQAVNHRERAIYEQGYEKGYEQGQKDGKEAAKQPDGMLLKYLDAAYKNGYEDGKKRAIETMKERANLPYDALGDYSEPANTSLPDDWYRENFVEGTK